MGFIITSLAFIWVLCMFIGAICNEKIGGARVAIIISILWLFIACSWIRLYSYDSYVSMKKTAASIEQYVSTIKIYQEYGLSGSTDTSGNLTATTDFKYQNYQTKMAEMIEDLRFEVVWFNNKLVGKKTMCSSFMWKGLIYPAPDSMVPYDMNDVLEEM